MKAFVLTREAVADGVLFAYLPLAYQREEDALAMFNKILREDIIPEYIEIRGYREIKDTKGNYTAIKGADIIHLSVTGVEMR